VPVQHAARHGAVRVRQAALADAQAALSQEALDKMVLTQEALDDVGGGEDNATGAVERDVCCPMADEEVSGAEAVQASSTVKSED
jgi:hypothetical protein